MFKTWLESQKDWNKFIHQRELSFMKQPENPLHQYAPIPEDEYYSYKPEKLYHVTTNLHAIKIDLALKARSQLSKSQNIGLGGGARNESPRTISLTYNYHRALEIYNAILYVINICQGKIKASEVYEYLNNAADLDFPEDELTHFENKLTYYVPTKYVKNGDVNKIKQILDKKIKTPKNIYDFFTELEKAVIEDQHANYADFSEDIITYNVIGFTATYENMVKINPQNVAIIQCLIRKNSKIEHIPQEVEIRVAPENITILKYIQPH